MKKHIAALLLAGIALFALPAASFAEDIVLKLDERIPPGAIPDSVLRVEAPAAQRVTLRHSGDGWLGEIPLTASQGLWQVSIANLGWQPGVYGFKFLVDGVWEKDPNRTAFVGDDGLLRRPRVLYLSWQHDPTTTMTIQWHGDGDAGSSVVESRPRSDGTWRSCTGAVIRSAQLDRWIHTVELTGLQPGTAYEFRLPGESATHWFRTLPAALDQTLRFIEGGDVFQLEAVMDTMNRLVAARDPEFVVIGGDLAYAENRPELAANWYRFLSSFTDRLVAPDGRTIPMIVAIGNHEMKANYVENHADFAPTREWRDKVAGTFYEIFAFPGHPGYGVLDAGDYLSLVVLDTHHTNPIDGEQLAWLEQTLAARHGVTHLFPVYHVPAYPSVRMPHDTRATLIRHLWLPLFESAGVHLAFEHHDHAFKITHPMKNGKVDPDGIVFVGDGAWGVSLREPAQHAWQRIYLRKSMPIHHVFEVELTRQQRVVRALDLGGNILDEFTQPTAAE